MSAVMTEPDYAERSKALYKQLKSESLLTIQILIEHLKVRVKRESNPKFQEALAIREQVCSAVRDQPDLQHALQQLIDFYERKKKPVVYRNPANPNETYSMGKKPEWLYHYLAKNGIDTTQKLNKFQKTTMKKLMDAIKVA